MEVLPYFFLSYSRADHSPLVKRFFDDLSDTIRIELNLPHTQSIGFYEETKYGPAAEWSDRAKEALQNCTIMVCLLSPAYLHCERAGKEWQVFEMRRRKVFTGPDTQESLPQSLAHVILPVTWTQWHGPLPKVIYEILSHPDHIHQREPLTTMFKFSGMSHSDYADFVKMLAHQIIEMTPAASKIKPLDQSPGMTEINSAFHLWDEVVVGSDKSRNRSKRDEDSEVDAESVTSAQFKEREGSNQRYSDSSGNLAKQLSPTSLGKTKVNEYSVVAFSTNADVLKRIEECCRFSVFKLKKEENPKKVLNDATINSRQSRNLLPDLYVIDLDNEPEALHTIAELSHKIRVPSEILVMSDDFERCDLHQFKKYTILQKSDLNDQLFSLMKRGARFGRNRKVFQNSGKLDPSRSERPVFLSFCHKDVDTANFLSRYLAGRAIEVWSMDETLEPGDDWYVEIVNGLDDAKVFLALITKDYLHSLDCRAEFDSFYIRAKRKKNNEQQPKLISVLYNSPDIENDELMKNKVPTYHYVKMSDEEYLDELDSLTRRIQDFLGIKDDDEDE